jgi:hypothetical protein
VQGDIPTNNGNDDNDMVRHYNLKKRELYTNTTNKTIITNSVPQILTPCNTRKRIKCHPK